MSRRLRVGISAFILLVGTVSVSLLSSEFQAAQGATQDQPAFAANDMQQLVNSYCVACHNDTLATADFSLQSVDFANPALHADSLERVVKKLRAHMMPPAGMPRPEFETYQIMTDWLEGELDSAWAANPNPGRITPVHRMNRYEYNNTINALLGLDVDVMDSLPGDPTADGSFDNMAASLPFSTAHMERYMSVARQVTRLATGLPPLGPTIITYEVPLFLKQNQRENNDMPFGSRGGVSVNHNFPVSGEYQLSVQLERNYQDYIKGLGWPQQLEIRLNGRLLERFTVGGEAPGTPAPLSFSGTGEPGTKLAAKSLVGFGVSQVHGGGSGLARSNDAATYSNASGRSVSWGPVVVKKSSSDGFERWGWTLPRETARIHPGQGGRPLLKPPAGAIRLL